MMTSRNNARLIEQYLHSELSPSEQLLFEARMIAYPELQSEVRLQRKVYRLVRMYHRKKLKEELEAVHQRLFNDPRKMNFRQRIERIFQPE
ncbi:hypothetical protein PbJCM13498_03260 [Prolixibacter bellariivorans]|uniref:Uncharacterized protein n=1 Tax=Prolixibacter bellariivorans TaxID=314319 RepID=A0A5M4AV00_9BACT|nr:hypothetical protein [Prolixibacter bellariivorans]GET31463.1 hypothetical protein PbJCM13498_03260 [Prolixibacter bellariivorans]